MPNPNRPTQLTKAWILARADGHRAYTGEWPNVESGEVIGVPDETWSNINAALVTGLRGLPAGDSLAKLLARHRGKRNNKDLPKLTERKVVIWAIAHHARDGAVADPERR